MSARRERYLRNEILFREVNERLNDLRAPTSPTDYLCECGDQECTATIELTVSEYERARADPTFFVVLPGHEAPAFERVVESGERFTLVEKLVDRDAAREMDPRRDE